MEHNIPESLLVKIVKVEGIGKYPYVSVQRGSKSLPILECARDSVTGADKMLPESGLELPKEVNVDFGCVAVGCSADRWIDIDNPSPVRHLGYSAVAWCI